MCPKKGSRRGFSGKVHSHQWSTHMRLGYSRVALRLPWKLQRQAYTSVLWFKTFSGSLLPDELSTNTSASIQDACGRCPGRWGPCWRGIHCPTLVTVPLASFNTYQQMNECLSLHFGEAGCLSIPDTCPWLSLHICLYCLSMNWFPLLALSRDKSCLLRLTLWTVLSTNHLLAFILYRVASLLELVS